MALMCICENEGNRGSEKDGLCVCVIKREREILDACERKLEGLFQQKGSAAEPF